MKFSDPEFRRFLLVGLFNTAAGYGMYLLFNLIVDYRAAYTLSYVIGVFLSYWITTRFVFRTSWSWRRLAAYPSVYLLQYMLGLALIWVFVHLFQVSEKLAPLLIIPLTIPVTFLASRFIIKGGTREAEHH